jgi:predicted dehydrogenase
VLIEKPICPTVAEAEELVALAKTQGVLLSVYQNRRWDSDFLTVRKLLSEGTVRIRRLCSPSTFSRDPCVVLGAVDA